MKKQTVDWSIKENLGMVYIAMIAIFLFLWWRACKGADKLSNAKCKLERTLHFEGVISKYKTDILAEKSTFLLNDTIEITIPRNEKEMYLSDHDTIVKIKDANLYIVKRSTLWIGQTQKKIDTFKFDCPYIDP